MDRNTERFIERMGQRFERDGLPRISGRMLAYLLLSDREQSLDELAEALRVSKASASTNARLLQRQGVLERVTRPGDRRDYYQVVESPYTQMLDQTLVRVRELRDLVRSGQDTAEAGDRHVRRRLEVFAGFFHLVLENLTAAQEQWEERDAAVARGASQSAG